MSWILRCLNHSEELGLDRATVGKARTSLEGLTDIVRELKDLPCEHGSGCQDKTHYMHPCLPCSARMEWEAMWPE